MITTDGEALRLAMLTRQTMQAMLAAHPLIRVDSTPRQAVLNGLQDAPVPRGWEELELTNENLIAAFEEMREQLDRADAAKAALKDASAAERAASDSATARAAIFEAGTASQASIIDGTISLPELKALGWHEDIQTDCWHDGRGSVADLHQSLNALFADNVALRVEIRRLRALLDPPTPPAPNPFREHRRDPRLMGWV